jgi:hypothetical protein
MDHVTILLRVLHIMGGILWVGSVLVTVLFLFKVIADLGPAGGQVMGALVRHRYLDVIPAAALVTVLSGIDLLRRASAGFDAAWMGSGVGITYSIGALTGLLALVVGLMIGRPATLKAVGLGPQVMAMPDGPDKAARVAELAALRARGQGALKVVAVLLVVATLCMATARYVR